MDCSLQRPWDSKGISNDSSLMEDDQLRLTERAQTCINVHAPHAAKYVCKNNMLAYRIPIRSHYGGPTFYGNHAFIVQIHG